MEERKVRYDYLRVVSCFLIVLLHFSSSYWDCVPINSKDFTTMTIYNAITRSAVPLFLMLSGCLTLEKSEDAFWGRRLFSRPIKLLITFYVWSFFYAFQGPAVELLKTGSVSAERRSNALSSFIFGHYHMWFCFLIVGYYLILPFAKKISEDIRILRLFLLMWFIYSFALNYLVSWSDNSWLSQYYNLFEVNILRGYWGYFLLGYYLMNRKFSEKKRMVIYAMGLLSLILTIVLTINECKRTGAYSQRWFSTGSPFVLMMCISIFVFFTYIKESTNQKINFLMKQLAETSFFIYMFHAFVLEKLNMIGISTISFNPIVSVPALTVLGFAVSAVCGLIVKKIPIVGGVFTYNWKRINKRQKISS